MSTTATCGHEIDGQYFISCLGHVAVKACDREGCRVVKHIILCQKCLDQAREEGLVLASDEARFAWLSGEGASVPVW